MDGKFNNYSLNNEEIEKILKDFEPLIEFAAKTTDYYADDCKQTIIVEIFKKLSKNR